MADIDIVQKRGIPSWVWLALVALALVVLFLVVGRRGNDGSTAAPTSRLSPPSAGLAAQA